MPWDDPTAVPDVVLAHYPDAIAVYDALVWSEWALSRVGFRPSNVLPVVAVCRDELMLRTEDGIASVWGPTFNAGSLAGMVFLGRTGIAAALGHAPGEDGRQRFVIFCLPHIAVAASGEIGKTRRAGMYHDSSACGALLALQQQIAAGSVDRALDPDDPEQSLLRRILAPMAVSHQVGESVPSLIEVTELARYAAVTAVEALVAGLESPLPVDVAVLSGVVIHGPDDRDYVASVQAYVEIDGVRRSLEH